MNTILNLDCFDRSPLNYRKRSWKSRSVLILWVTALGACGSDKSWEGILYPNRYDLTTHATYGFFESVKECRRVGEQLAGESGTYECGFE